MPYSRCLVWISLVFGVFSFATATNPYQSPNREMGTTALRGFLQGARLSAEEIRECLLTANSSVTTQAALGIAAGSIAGALGFGSAACGLWMDPSGIASALPATMVLGGLFQIIGASWVIREGLKVFGEQRDAIDRLEQVALLWSLDPKALSEMDFGPFRRAISTNKKLSKRLTALGIPGFESASGCAAALKASGS